MAYRSSLKAHFWVATIWSIRFMVPLSAEEESMTDRIVRAVRGELQDRVQVARSLLD